MCNGLLSVFLLVFQPMYAKLLFVVCKCQTLAFGSFRNYHKFFSRLLSKLCWGKGVHWSPSLIALSIYYFRFLFGLKNIISVHLGYNSGSSSSVWNCQSKCKDLCIIIFCCRLSNIGFLLYMFEDNKFLWISFTCEFIIGNIFLKFIFEVVFGSLFVKSFIRSI